MHPLRPILVGSAVLSLLIPLGASAAAATPLPTVRASADTGCRGTVPGDVNGDDYADLAVGAPGHQGARGAVHLFYGYRGKLRLDAQGSARNDLVLTQATKGVPGTSEKGDRFGATTVLADVNGDRCADLIIGVPGEDRQTGAISVLYGSPSGLTTSGAQQLKSTVLLRPRPPGLNELGSALTVGDFDGDGVMDVAALGTDATEFSTPASVIVLYGHRRGLGRGRAAVQVTPSSLGLTDTVLGGALSSGDYDGDGDTELAVATRSGGRGGVQIVQRRGPSFVAGTSISVDSAGFPGRRSAYVNLGGELASGDVHADGFDDLIIADPDYGLGEPESEYGKGAVVVLTGSRSGLTTNRSQFWTQDSPGVQGRSAYGHEFGGALAVGQLDAEAGDDLVVGAPGYGGAWEQSATVLLGSSTGLTTAGVGGTRYTQSTRGITGTNETGDIFGGRLEIAHLAGPGRGALIVGAPGEDVGSVTNAGSITQLGSSTSGPDARHSQTVTLNSGGARGSAARGDHFGDALS